MTFFLRRFVIRDSHAYLIPICVLGVVFFEEVINIVVTMRVNLTGTRGVENYSEICDWLHRLSIVGKSISFLKSKLNFRVD